MWIFILSYQGLPAWPFFSTQQFCKLALHLLSASLQIDEIVLIGGSTRIIAVQNLLESYFPGKVSRLHCNCSAALLLLWPLANKTLV